MVQRTSVPLQFHPPSTPSPSYNETSMMSLAVRWQSARFRWAHPSRARPGHPLIFKREALRAPAPKLCRHKYTMIVSEWLSQLSIVVPACWPLPFHRALQTVSTEHEHDKDRSSPGGREPVTVAVAPNLPCHGSPSFAFFLHLAGFLSPSPSPSIGILFFFGFLSRSFDPFPPVLSFR